MADVNDGEADPGPGADRVLPVRDVRAPFWWWRSVYWLLTASALEAAALIDAVTW